MMAGVLPGIPRLYTSLAEWLACVVCISTVQRVLHGWKLWCVLITALIWQCIYLSATGNLPVIFWIPCLNLAALFMYLLMFICCDLCPLDIAYYCTHAFILAESAAALEWQLHCFLWQDKSPSVSLILLAAVYAAVFLIAGYLCRKNTFPYRQQGVLLREFGIELIIATAIFASSNLGFLSAKTPLSGSYSKDVYIIRTVIDLCGMAVLYAHQLQCQDLRTRLELESIQAVMATQYKQYQISKETIDLINRKYHDLKHHILVLRSELDSDRRASYLDQIEKDIHTYEQQNRTGNHVLDTILTSKSLICHNLGISLTCMADGKLLNFMEVMDISSIFGNALDNAIECERQISDAEKRLIHIKVAAQKGHLLIDLENYCEQVLSVQEGLPVSTKGNTGFHGYGLKSIRYAAKKYNGSMTVTIEDSWFVLRVLLPLP